jgi:preprotein translocase subunit YajC
LTLCLVLTSSSSLERRNRHAIHLSLSFSENSVFISSAYAQAAAGAGDTQSTLLSMLPLVLMFVVLYFVMIRPQMKRQKEHKAMVEALTKGDEVVTAGGFLGKVSKVGETYIGVELADGMEVQMQRTAVVQVLPKGTMK